MFKRIFFILYCVLCALSAFALNEAELDSLYTQFRLEEVEVTARVLDKDVIQPQTLKGPELQRLNALSVADALRYFSGVQIKDYGGVGGIKTVDIRSMGSHHLGVFYDGVEIGNAQNGVVDLGKFSMENIEEISLYNGQKSELLQPAKDYGSSGTLYLRTRRPKFDANKPYNVMVGMRAGTFGLANPSVLYEHKLTENIHLSANAEYQFATGRYHFRVHKVSTDGKTAWDTTGVRQNGDIQSWRAEIGLFGYLPRGKWHIKGYFYDSEKGIPRAIIRNVWTSEQRQWDRNAFVQSTFENTWMAGDRRLSLLATAKYSYDQMRYLNPDTTLMYIDNEFRQQEAYLSAAFRADVFSWWEVAVSADYIYNHLNSSMSNFVFPRRHTGLIAISTAFHYKWFRAQVTALETLIHDHLERPAGMINKAAKDYSRITPSVSLSYQPLLSERLYLHAFYKHIFRMPTFNDLYYTDIGNTALRPEFTTQYDGGFEYNKALKLDNNAMKSIDVHVKADGYFNQVRDKIIAVPKGNSQYRWQMLNLGYVEIRGCDINAGMTMHFDHGVEWAFNGSYTYQKAQDFTDPSKPEYGGQIAYIPWHSGSIVSNMSWRDWSLHYSFIYVGERYHTSANIRANYELPWYTHDLSVSKIWQLKGWRLATTIEVNNFLNQQYAIILNYPMPGLNGKLIVRAYI